MPSKYPELFELFQARQNESWQWAAGDMLINLCGPPPKSGVNDGGFAIMELIKKDFEENDIIIDCSVKYLAILRNVANTFSGSTRVDPLSWSIHRIAGSPEALEQIIKRLTTEGKKITSRNVANALLQIKNDVAIFPEIKADYNSARISVDKINKKITEYAAVMPPEVMADIREECLSLIEDARKALKFLGGSDERSHIAVIGSVK